MLRGRADSQGRRAADVVPLGESRRGRVRRSVPLRRDARRTRRVISPSAPACTSVSARTARAHGAAHVLPRAPAAARVGRAQRADPYTAATFVGAPKRVPIRYTALKRRRTHGQAAPSESVPFEARDLGARGARAAVRDRAVPARHDLDVRAARAEEDPPARQVAGDRGRRHRRRRVRRDPRVPGREVRRRTARAAPGAPGRAHYLQWLHFAEGSAMFPILLGCSCASKARRPSVLGPYAEQQRAAILGYMDATARRRPVLVGDQFTAADILNSYILEMAAPGEGAEAVPARSGRLPRAHHFTPRRQEGGRARDRSTTTPGARTSPSR